MQICYQYYLTQLCTFLLTILESLVGIDSSLSSTLILRWVMKNIKRRKKITFAVAAFTPIIMKSAKRMVEIYRTVSLLKIDSKVFEKYIQSLVCSDPQHLYKEPTRLCTEKRGASFLRNDLWCNWPKHARWSNSSTDFSKGIIKALHMVLLTKVTQMGVGGCVLEVICDCFQD